MEKFSLCRTCLRQTCLQPIFVDCIDHTQYSNAIFVATGLKIEASDGLPQKMCTECADFVRSSLEFRQKCKESEISLLDMKKELVNKHLGSESFDVETCTGDETEDTDEDDKPLKHFVDKSNSGFKSNKVHIKAHTNNVGNIDKNKLDFKYNKVHIKTVKDIRNIADKSDLDFKSNKDNHKTVTDNKINAKNHIKTDTAVGNYFKSNKDRIKSVTDKVKDIEVAIETKKKDKTDNLLAENKVKSLQVIKESKVDSEGEVKVLERLYEVLEGTGKRVVCRLCGKELALRSVGSHVSRAHPSEDTRVMCELCGRRLTRHKMNRHMLLVHSEGNFKCIHCGVDHQSREALVSHAPACAAQRKKRKPSAAARQPVQCGECGVWLQSASLRAHQRRHAGLAPVCEHCGLRLSNKLRLLEHARAVHGRARLRCALCAYSCAGLPALRNHERRHRGEKPFVCETCGARFHAAYLLAQHRHSHRTDKLVKCPQCPATFKARNSLHAHRRSAHAAGAWRCRACGRRYRARHYAIRHLRQVHRYRGNSPPISEETRASVTEE